MKRLVNASNARFIKASSTRDRIASLEERIADIEERLHSDRYRNPEDRIDDHIELEELKEQLNFAWQDDGAEYNYALEQQEFNPDGSLKGYDDIYESTNVKSSSEWAASWSKRQDPSMYYGAPYYVMSVPSGTARVLPDDAEVNLYNVEIKFRNGEKRVYSGFEDYIEAMNKAEKILFNEI